MNQQLLRVWHLQSLQFLRQLIRIERRCLTHCSQHNKHTSSDIMTCTGVKDPADHSRQHNCEERQNLEISRQQRAALGMCQSLRSQRSLHDHLRKITDASVVTRDPSRLMIHLAQAPVCVCVSVSESKVEPGCQSLNVMLGGMASRF